MAVGGWTSQMKSKAETKILSVIFWFCCLSFVHFDLKPTAEATLERPSVQSVTRLTENIHREIKT